MKNWEVKKLGEVCELSAGGDVPKDNFSETQSDKYKIPIYANGEKNEGLYGYTNIAKVTKPSVTVSARGTIGFSVKRLEAFFPVVRLIVVTPKNQKELDLDFLDYSLKRIDFKHSGSSIPQLTVPMIRDYKIPLPPLPEQQRIVSILDDAFAAIAKAKANAEQNLKNAKELFESYLQKIMSEPRLTRFNDSQDLKNQVNQENQKNQGSDKGDGWEEKKLGDTCVVERGSSPRPIDKYQTDSPDGVNWIKIGDTKGIDKYIYTTKEKITKEGAEKSRYVKDGDFILSNSMSFGKPYIMKTDGYIHDGWFVFRLPNYLDKDFFYYILTSPNVQKQIQSLGAGAIVKNISGDLVKKVDLFFPKSLKEQQTIVRQLDALRAETQKLEAVYQKKIDDLEELKKSILQKAFAGELASPGGARYDSEVASPLAYKKKSITSPDGA